MNTELTYIGKIVTPYTDVKYCPCNIQTNGPRCQIELFDEFKLGLEGLSAGEHILVLYWLEGALRDQLLQVGREGIEKGTFSLRSPNRPNPIGAAVLPIEAIEDGTIIVKGLDCLNNTPLLDIKPAIYKERAD